MTPKERVLAALAHREPDRVPWGEHSIDYNVYEDILGRKDVLCAAKFRETQALWEGRRDEVVESYKRDRVDLIRALDMDMVFCSQCPPRGDKPKPWKKLDDETYEDEHGNLYRISATTHALMLYKPNTRGYKPPTLKSVEQEIEKLMTTPADRPDESAWEVLQHCQKELGETHFIFVFTGDVVFPGFGPTEEARMMSLLEEPEICAKLAELAGRYLVRQLPIYAELGVDGVMPAGDLGHSTGLMASPAIYRKMLLPWHKAYCDEAHRLGLKVLKHCCGNIREVVHHFVEAGYDAYEGIQHSGGMDMKWLKQRVGDRLTLWGGIWHEHVILGDAADIREDARYAFTHAAPGGGFIMGSSHSLAVDAKAENILEMKRVRDQWGVYPVRPATFT